MTVAPLVQVCSVTKRFAADSRFWSQIRTRWVHAVDDVSFEIGPAETFSLVGESGCGKTTTGKLVLRLDRPTSGRILFQGQDLGELRGAALRQYRASVQAVFQDPWSSLNPRMRAAAIVAEPVEINEGLNREERRARVEDLLRGVGLEPAMAASFPHEFSGGQRQRVAIARALALSPRLVVLDEPVSALDVSVRAQIMNLLKDLQAERGISYLLIAHNLATVRYLAHRVGVMYLGRLVEHGQSEAVFRDPLHPYTRALIAAAAPRRTAAASASSPLWGEVPSPVAPPPGCRFHPRCPVAIPRCAVESPALKAADGQHAVACHLY